MVALLYDYNTELYTSKGCMVCELYLFLKISLLENWLTSHIKVDFLKAFS